MKDLLENNLDPDDIIYYQYERVAWPEYQILMNRPDWVKHTMAIGDSDMLVPAEWIHDEMDIDSEGIHEAPEYDSQGMGPEDRKEEIRNWEEQEAEIMRAQARIQELEDDYTGSGFEEAKRMKHLLDLHAENLASMDNLIDEINVIACNAQSDSRALARIAILTSDAQISRQARETWGKNLDPIIDNVLKPFLHG